MRLSENNITEDRLGAVLPSTNVTTMPVSGLWQNGFVLALVANVLWGTTFLASKMTLAVWGPFTASVLRFVVAVIGLRVGFLFLGRKIQASRSARHWLQLAGIGLSGFGLLYPLQLYGLKMIPSGLSAAIMLTSPLILIALGLVFLKEKASWQKTLALLLGIAGGLLLLSPSLSGNLSTLLLGAALTLAAAVVLALSVIFTKKLSPFLDAGSITYWSMLIGLVFLVPFAFFERQPISVSHESLVTGILSLVYLGLICSVGCFLIWNRAIRIASPKDIASTMHVKTPIAILLGTLVAGEPISTQILLGTSLVTVGVWLSQFGSKSRGAR